MIREIEVPRPLLLCPSCEEFFNSLEGYANHYADAHAHLATAGSKLSGQVKVTRKDGRVETQEF